MYNSQEEMAKPKGTPVTVERFAAWKRKFDAEMKDKRRRELENEIRSLPPKGLLMVFATGISTFLLNVMVVLSERKERENFENRLTGRAIFERKRLALAESEESEEEDGADVLDISKYDREARDREREQSEREEDQDRGFMSDASD